MQALEQKIHLANTTCKNTKVDPNFHIMANVVFRSIDLYQQSLKLLIEKIVMHCINEGNSVPRDC